MDKKTRELGKSWMKIKEEYKESKINEEDIEDEIDKAEDAVEAAEDNPVVKDAEEEIEDASEDNLNEGYGWGYDGEIIM